MTPLLDARGTEGLPPGHVAFAATDAHGLLTFAAVDGAVHVHLFRPDGALDCLAIGTPEHVTEWRKRLAAAQTVADKRTDSTPHGDDDSDGEDAGEGGSAP